ncbi:MAG: AMP-binding protein [Arenicellaceae bacterium]|nr:AMP-binding protein [Arenicellaceae bacterium]
MPNDIWDLFADRCTKSPDSEAVVYSGKRWTWKELECDVNQLSNRLFLAGVSKGSVVGVYFDHSFAQIASIFAISKLGGIFTLISPHLKSEQVKSQVFDSAITHIVGQATFVSQYVDFFANTNISILELDDFGNFTNPPATATIEVTPTPTSHHFIPKDVACYIYTSGSTGKPKGVVVPHKTLLDGARIVSSYLKITRSDNILSILSFGFDYGLNQLLSAVYTGAKIVVLNYRLPMDLLSSIEKEKITAFAAVPSLWPNLFHEKLVNRALFGEFEHLRYITTAGGTHSKKLLENLTRFFPNTDIIIMYGLTESFRSTFLPPEKVLEKIGSIGKAVPEVEIMIVNEKGKPCLSGEKGELIHRGAFVNYGYLNNKELTKLKYKPLSLAGSGCLPEYAVRSGDLVSMDDEGFIFFHGRIDSLIKVHGHRVSPGEIEDIALSFKDIRYAVAVEIISTDDDSYIALAYSTYSEGDIDKLEFQDYLKSKLPYYAVPKLIRFYQDVHLNKNGKIDYARIKAEIGASEP